MPQAPQSRSIQFQLKWRKENRRHLNISALKCQSHFNFVSVHRQTSVSVQLANYPSNYPNSSFQPNFPTLTRMLSYSEMTNAVKKIVSYFNWEVFGFFLYNFEDANKGHSECSLVLSPFNRHFNNGTSFRESFENGTHELLKEKLNRLKEKSRSKLIGGDIEL